MSLQFEHQSRQLLLLHQVRNLVARETEPDAFLRAVVEATHQVFGYPLVGVYLLQGEQLVLQHATGYACPLRTLHISQGVMGRTAREGQPNLVLDTRSDENYLAIEPSFTSEIAVPLWNQQQVIGVFNVESHAERPLGEDDLQMMLLLGQYISLGIERAQLFHALRESEEHNRTLIDNLPGVVYRCANDEHWTAHFVNDKIELLTGYPASDFIHNQHRALNDIVFPEDRPYIQNTVAHALAHKEPYDLEYRMLHRDGTVRWVVERGQAIYNEQGQVRWLDGVIFDIEERRRAQSLLSKRSTEIEEANRSLDSIIENLPIMVFMKDAETLRFVRWNKAAEDLVGYSRHEVLGKNDYDFFPKEQADFFVEKDRKVLASNEIGEISEENIQTRHRGNRLLYTRKVPIHDVEGKPKFLLGTSIDITERKQAEAAIYQLNAELAQASQMKDEFLANMSHELRTPLNAILVFSESLTERIYGPLTPRQVDVLNKVYESGQHLLALINDILDVSKAVSGKINLDLRPVSVANVCRTSMQMVQEAAIKKRIKLFQLHEHSAAFLQADERRLVQILVNLLSNAVKFTPEGGKVGLDVVADRQQEVLQFTVWDTGMGIANDDKNKLFRPFVQLDSSLSRKHEGSGLGLALAWRLTELHGGSIVLESTPGEGSRFTVMLPWLENVQQATSLSAIARLPIEKGESTSHPVQNGATESATPENAPLILLAEDNENSSEAFKTFLCAHGYRVITATTGNDTFNLATKHRPALILMDIQMPDIDGLQATRQLRQHPDLTHTPIIALTALVMPGDRERCLAAGANEYLGKPVSMRILIKLIEQQLQRNGKQ